MIREERDTDFWREIAGHPSLAGVMMGMDPQQVASAAMRVSILPLASDNGGLFLGQMDQLGLTVELHALYRPAGWGREVHKAAIEAAQWVFANGVQVVIAHEIEHLEHSRAPRTFGFVQAGDWRDTVIGRCRAWVLTKSAWEASKAYRRAICRLQ